jgi:hypothetical protein
MPVVDTPVVMVISPASPMVDPGWFVATPDSVATTVSATVTNAVLAVSVV